MEVTPKQTRSAGDKIENLLSEMTLEEKVSLLAGADNWHTVAIDRLGIPSLKVTDGPNGARGDAFVGGVTAAAFPAGILLASTWNTALVQRVGKALAQEARTKGARVLLAPTVNIHRSPLGGRNFESFSEDPYLTARMAVAYINGVQSEGVGATVKHYIANEQEFERYSIDSQVDERTLREIYLRPFQAAVLEANTWAMMASYNLVNGVAASEHPYFLHDILREEWGWDGLVISDWILSIKSTAASVNAGCDLEMPGPAIWRGDKLLRAVQTGEVAESNLDESVRRLLLLLTRSGKFEHPEEEPEQAVDRPEHRALIREAAGEGMVLLKNSSGLLPLERGRLGSVAIIGPNARAARIMGGGSAQVNAHYQVAPFDALVEKIGDAAAAGCEQGCTIHKLLPLIDPSDLYAGTEGTEHGLRVEYFNGAMPAGDPVHVTAAPSTEFAWFGPLPEGVDRSQFAVRAAGRFIPDQTGVYTFGIASAGLSRLYLDGREVIDNWTAPTPGGNYFGMGTTEVQYQVELSQDQEYTLTLEFAGDPALMLSAVRLGCLPPMPADLIERAAALAGQSDVALVFVGLSSEWESEGFDRADLRLPGEQDALIEKVAAVNPNTVVVINAGSAVEMPWLDKVAAVLQAWYPGQEAGNSIADVLFGDVNPSGKLPQTFPARLQDTPSYLNFPGENGRVLYGERLFVGYRYYDKLDIEPLFPFGFGLSYTTFDYSNLRLSAPKLGPNDTLTVSVDITNTGSRRGQEVVQLYVSDQEARLQRPERELKGFAKVSLEPGEHKTVTISLTPDDLAYFDDSTGQWVAEAGAFTVHVGASSRDIRATAGFELTETSHWPTQAGRNAQ
ncbi:MAG: beta-glucosidase H [Chloroflexia bacterium]